MSSQDEQHGARPLFVVGHVTVRTGRLTWTCPRCGGQHERDARAMLARHVAAEWFVCPDAGYFVAITHQAETHLRRAHLIPELLITPTLDSD
jgi:predicted RNA-binding Zn-ribbon protein involved in translation (DUF1610 family)